MQVTSTQKYIRTSPRKLRLVARSVVGQPATTALFRLKLLPKQAAVPILKVIKTAIADAKNNFHLDENHLLLKSIQVGAGRTLKRGRPVSRGQYHQIKKRTAHVTVLLESPTS